MNIKEKNQLINDLNIIINHNIYLCSRYKRNEHYKFNVESLQDLLKRIIEEV